jgi:hypothetical protein
VYCSLLVFDYRGITKPFHIEDHGEATRLRRPLQLGILHEDSRMQHTYAGAVPCANNTVKSADIRKHACLTGSTVSMHVSQSPLSLVGCIQSLRQLAPAIWQTTHLCMAGPDPLGPPHCALVGSKILHSSDGSQILTAAAASLCSSNFCHPGPASPLTTAIGRDQNLALLAHQKRES